MLGAEEFEVEGIAEVGPRERPNAREKFVEGVLNGFCKHLRANA